MEQTKYCRGCLKTKQINTFSKNQSQCKECKKNLAKKARQNNPEKFKEIDKINNYSKKIKIDNSEKICEQCKIIKNSTLFNYPYNKNTICKECILENKIKENNNITEKKCSKCNTIKSIDFFAKNISKFSGYSSLCK